LTEKKPFGFPALKWVAIAAIAGMFAGTVAVYMKETGSGNGAVQEMASADSRCGAARASVTALTPFLKGQVAAMSPADNPRPLSDLTFQDGTGKTVDMTAFKDKTILLNLWATWCVPCREEMPALDALQKSAGNDAFEVVAVNIDTGTDDKPRAFLNEIGVESLGHYRDSSMGVFNALKKEGLAFGLPVTLLLDKNGCLLGSMNGPAAWNSPDAQQLVKAATAL
jgi:thiol-disulfide isomerase/thioredoxin